MHILSIISVSKSYGFKPLLQNINLGFNDNDRIGVVGVNGSGKSTLLRLIAGAEVPDSGRIVFTEGISVGYLPQNPPFVPEQTVLQTVFAADNAQMNLLRDYEMACHELSAGAGPEARLLQRVENLAHELEVAGAWDVETNARAVLTRLGIADTTARMATLSGGQRKRVALASALIANPTLLILDEPTNHLDAETIAWLESYLERYRGALLLVTHDRYFLDRVTSRILEIERDGVQSFAGNYAYYLEKKEEQETLRAVAGQKHAMLVRRELAWLRRGAKARTRKSKARLDAAAELIARPQEKARAELDISVTASRIGKKILELADITKSYDGLVLLDNFSYLLKPGERIGIIGPNGAGKTTLLDIITGRVTPETGSVTLGKTVRIGYYDQESRDLDESARVIDYIREVAERIETADGAFITAGQMLEKFLFTPAQQYALVGNLSGGERRRLYLLRVLMGAPNVLLLDEPTNDLDIPTLVTLEDYLDGFPGCLLVVSHDRYFLDRTVDQIFRLEGAGRVRAYPGNFTAFLETQKREEKAALPVAPTVRAQPARTLNGTSAPRKLSFKERRELDALEISIPLAEQRQTELDKELADNASDAYLVHQLYQEREKLTAQLAHDMERWAELAELA